MGDVSAEDEEEYASVVCVALWAQGSTSRVMVAQR